MIKTAVALYNFWSSFSIPAFPEDQIPDDLHETTTESVEMPYITYQIIKPNWRDQISTYAKVYYRDTSYLDITTKVNEIENRIGEGVQLSVDGGFLLLFKDINFCQFTPTGDPAVKMAYLSLVLEVDSD